MIRKVLDAEKDVIHIAPEKWSMSRPCIHPEHNPPSMIYLEPGEYEYTCPGCGEKKRFFVGGITC